MKAFAKAVNEADSIKIKEAEDDMFAYWLSVITEKEIVNKDIIENACKEMEVIQMAMSAIARQSEDKIMRQAYQRRKDEIYFNNMEREIERERREQAERKLRLSERELERSERKLEQSEQKLEQSEQKLEQSEQEKNKSLPKTKTSVKDWRNLKHRQKNKHCRSGERLNPLAGFFLQTASDNYPGVRKTLGRRGLHFLHTQQHISTQ